MEKYHSALQQLLENQFLKLIPELLLSLTKQNLHNNLSYTDKLSI